MCQHLLLEASSSSVSCDLMVVLLVLTLHPQQPSQKDGDLAAGSKSIILLWQYMAGRFKCIWIPNQAFVLVDIIFSGYVVPHKVSGI